MKLLQSHLGMFLRQFKILIFELQQEALKGIPELSHQPMFYFFFILLVKFIDRLYPHHNEEDIPKPIVHIFMTQTIQETESWSEATKFLFLVPLCKNIFLPKVRNLKNRNGSIIHWYKYFCFINFVVQKIKCRAFKMLCKCSFTELPSQPCIFAFKSL